MDTYLAVGIAEGFEECHDEAQQLEAWQHLVDTGTVWQLQGCFGRTAKRLIEEGIITDTHGIVAKDERLWQEANA